MKKILLLTLGIVAIGVLGLVTSDSQAATWGHLDHEQMLTTNGRGCQSINIATTTWCMTGGPVSDCSGAWPACAGTCQTDCTSASGWRLGGGSSLVGCTKSFSCDAYGSTYDVRDCDTGSTSCECSGSIISTGHGCSRGGTTFLSC